LPPRSFLVNDYFQDRRQAQVLDASPMMKEAAQRGNGTNSGATRLHESFPQRSDRPIEDLHTYDPSQEPAQNRLDPVEEQHEPAVKRTGSPHYSGGISGPSFLGLSDEPAQSGGFVYDDDPAQPSEYDYDPSYLLEETPRGTSWKAYALLLIVMIFGGLGYLQWKYQTMRPPARDLSNVLGNNGEAIPEGGIPDFAKEKARQDQEQQKQKQAQAAGAANTAATSDAASPDSQDNKPDSTNPDSNTNQEKTAAAAAQTPQGANAQSSQGANAQTAQSPGVSVTSNGPRPQDGVTVTTDGKRSGADSADDEKPESDTTGADTPDQPVTRKSQAQKNAKSQADDAPQSLGAKDPLLIRAQKFLHGSGVPQNCNMGLNLLRQSAQSNPKAQIQMGALYMTGHCVTQDRVSAYKWFSQALAQEPNNEYVERNRASLWASMTQEERNRIRQANFY
jgi:TPR repeat protein